MIHAQCPQCGQPLHPDGTIPALKPGAQTVAQARRVEHSKWIRERVLSHRTFWCLKPSPKSSKAAKRLGKFARKGLRRIASAVRRLSTDRPRSESEMTIYAETVRREIDAWAEIMDQYEDVATRQTGARMRTLIADFGREFA